MTGKRQGGDRREQQKSDRRATGERQGVLLRQEGERKATRERQACRRGQGRQIVHGFLYRWKYVKKMGTNVLHLFGFLLRCHFIVSGIDFQRLVNFNLFWNHYIPLFFDRKISLLCDIMMV